MRNFIVMSLIVLLSGIFGCAGMRVAVKYDDSVDFSSYKTFYFVRPSQAKQSRDKGQVKNRFFSKEVMQEIEPLMESRGLVKADSKNEADIFILFYGSVHSERNYAPPSYHVGRRGRIRRITPGHSYRVKKGALVIDIVDRLEKELIWQGIGRGVVNPNSPERLTRYKNGRKEH